MPNQYVLHLSKQPLGRLYNSDIIDIKKRYQDLAIFESVKSAIIGAQKILKMWNLVYMPPKVVNDDVAHGCFEIIGQSEKVRLYIIKIDDCLPSNERFAHVVANLIKWDECEPQSNHYDKKPICPTHKVELKWFGTSDDKKWWKCPHCDYDYVTGL